MAPIRKKKKTIIESDDESNLNAENDPDWIPEDDDETDRNRSNSDSNDNDTSLPEHSQFTSTEGFKVKAVKTTKQSTHLIWTMFGQLFNENNNKIVDQVKSRLYCINCFNDEKFKRYVTVACELKLIAHANYR